jgi:outer membrane receptor protein involved in Fe transport
MKYSKKTMAAAAALMVASTAAEADTIQYGALEELFGEPVTTSATGAPQRATDAPVPMTIVTQEDIRRSGAYDIPGVLRDIVGVNVQRHSTFGADVGVRGYNQAFSPRILVLVNGRQVYLDDYGRTSWANIPVQLGEIRQIEVVKGPSTALFGFNAISGVINILTFNPLYDEVSVAEARYGSNNYREASFAQSAKWGDDAGVRISGGIARADEFEDGERAGATDPRKESLLLDSSFQVTDALQLGFETSYTNSRFGELVTGTALGNDQYRTYSFKGSASLDTSAGLTSMTVYQNTLDLNFGGTFPVDQEVFVAKLDHLITLGSDHTLRAAGEYRTNELSYLPGGVDTGEVSYSVASVGGMWNWNINDQWTLNNALRVDFLSLERTGAFLGPTPFTNANYDRDLTEYSANSGIVFRATDNDTLRLSYGRGVMAPSLLEFGLNAFPFAATPNLDPTIVNNIDLGWDHKMEGFADLLRINVFVQKSENLRDFASQAVPIGGGANLLLTQNSGDSEVYGVEVSLEGHIGDNWTWDASYGLAKVEDSITSGVIQNFEDTNSDHEANLHVGYEDGPWTVDGFVNYVSEREFESGGALIPVNAYVDANLRVAYAITESIELGVVGRGLVGGSHQETLGSDVDQQLFATVRFDF